MISRRTKFLLRWLVATSLLIALIWFIGPQKIAAELKGANPVYLLATLLVMLFDALVRSWNWQQLIRPFERVAPLGRVFYAYLVGGFWGYILPSSFSTDAARAAMAARVLSMPFASALSTVISLNALGLLASAAVGVVGSMWLYAQGVQRPFALLCGLVFSGQLVVVLAILWMLGHARIWIMSVKIADSSFKSRMHRMLAKLAAAFMPLGDSSASRARLISVAVFSQMMRPVGFALVCIALGAKVPFAALLMWLPFGTLANLLPISVLGFGGKQVIQVSYFALFGLTSHLAFAVATTHQLVQLTADLVGGIVFVVSGDRRLAVRDKLRGNNAPQQESS